MTPNRDFKVTPLFDAHNLSNGTRYRQYVMDHQILVLLIVVSSNCDSVFDLIVYSAFVVFFCYIICTLFSLVPIV